MSKKTTVVSLKTATPSVTLPAAEAGDVVVQDAPAAPVSPADPALPYPLKRLLMLGDIASRTATSGTETVKLLTTRFKPETVSDLLDMQKALLKHVGQLDQSWRQGVTQWFQQALALKSANTVSKLLEQEFNLVGQWGDLVTKQLTDVATLLESTQVGYSYWLSTKTGLPPSPH